MYFVWPGKWCDFFYCAEWGQKLPTKFQFSRSCMALRWSAGDMKIQNWSNQVEDDHFRNLKWSNWGENYVNRLCWRAMSYFSVVPIPFQPGGQKPFLKCYYSFFDNFGFWICEKCFLQFVCNLEVVCFNIKFIPSDFLYRFFNSEFFSVEKISCDIKFFICFIFFPSLKFFFNLKNFLLQQNIVFFLNIEIFFSNWKIFYIKFLIFFFLIYKSWPFHLPLLPVWRPLNCCSPSCLLSIN